MICSNLHKLIGFACQPINEQGSIAQIATPFTFADGDRLPVYVQSYDSQVHRFFDDGQTILHFIGRGMKFKNGHQLRFLANLAEKHGAALNKNGVLEVFSQNSAPQEAFSKYLSCLVAITEWEKEHEGLNADGAAFVAEVAHALTEGDPAGHFEKSPLYLGSSGKKHTLDFKFNGVGYIAIKPSQQSAAPALYKLVDITNRNSNVDEEVIVVVDDRFDKAAAKRVSQVFRTVAEVVSFSRIETKEARPRH